MMNHTAILKRLNKAIDKVQSRQKPATVHLVKNGDPIENLDGLVVILNLREDNEKHT